MDSCAPRLAQAFPNAELHLVLPKPYRALFDVDPNYQSIISPPGDETSTTEWVRQRRAEKYDIALAFHASPSSARWARRSKAAKVLVHSHERKRATYGTIVGEGRPTSAIERDLNVVRTLGWTGESPPTSLNVAPEWLEQATRLLGEKSSKRVVLGLGASRLSKQWPLESLLALARALRVSGSEVIAVYESESSILYPQILTQLRTACRVVRTQTLTELAGVLATADVFFGNDSGAKHLAAAVGAKTVTAFGPESVGEWHGYDPKRHHALRKQVACRTQDPEPAEFAWCGVEVCPLSSHSCMTLISPIEVREHILNLLNES